MIESRSVGTAENQQYKSKGNKFWKVILTDL